MLFTQSFSRTIASVVFCALVVFQVPGQAAVAIPTSQKEIDPSSVTESTLAALKKGRPVEKLKVEKTCAICGCSESCAGSACTNNHKKPQDASLLTDSLWGNLILELAYERDTQLSRLAKKVKLMNFATTTSVLGIAGATLAQSISAVYVLNQPSGVPDSYAPLNVGLATSGAMIALIAARLYCGHQLGKHIRQRQFQIKGRVESILAHLEYSQAQCTLAQAQLEDLIGQRASNEWIQLWESSHKMVANNGQHIGLDTNRPLTVANTAQ